MRSKIGVALLSLLLLSVLAVPMAGAVDNGKSIIKEMVQAPTDYSVGMGGPFHIMELDRQWSHSYMMFRHFMYSPGAFHRL